MNALITTLRYVLLTAIRDRMVSAIIIAQLAVLGGASLMAASALAEGRAMGLAMAGEGFRVIMMLGLITFISLHVRRMEETREIEAILTRPISRATFVLAYYAAYAGIGVLLSLCAMPLLVAGLAAGGPGLLEWQASLALECVIVVAAALFCALSLGSATASVLAGIGLYTFARLAAFFRAIAESHTGLSAYADMDKITTLIIKGIAAAVPRLDLFGQGQWLVYGSGEEWGLPELLLQTAVIVPLLLVATIRDMHVKRY
jgi:hypothetical protein